jgi:hypothetical protein
VCGAKCKKTPAEIRQYLAAVSAMNFSAVAIFDAGPGVGTSRDSRLVTDGWLPLLAEWVRAGGYKRFDEELNSDLVNFGGKPALKSDDSWYVCTGVSCASALHGNMPFLWVQL